MVTTDGKETIKHVYMDWIRRRSGHSSIVHQSGLSYGVEKYGQIKFREVGCWPISNKVAEMKIETEPPNCGMRLEFVSKQLFFKIFLDPRLRSDDL